MELNSVNISQQHEAGFALEIVHPATGDKLGGVITIRGDESKEVQNYNRKRFQELQKRERMNKGKSTDYTLAEIEDIGIESAIVRCMGWKNIKKDGIELEFNKEMKAELVSLKKNKVENSNAILCFSSKGSTEKIGDFASKNNT